MKQFMLAFNLFILCLVALVGILIYAIPGTTKWVYWAIVIPMVLIRLIRANLLVKLPILLVLLSLTFVSCGGDPVKDRAVISRLARFRAKKMWFSDATYRYYTSHNTEIVKADSAYNTGDTVLLPVNNYEDATYILIEKVK